MNQTVLPIIAVKNNQLILYKEKTKIALSDIILLEAKANYTCIYFSNGKKIIVPKTLKIFEDILSIHNFYRIHRAFLINWSHLKSYNSDLGEVFMTGNFKAVTSRRKKTHFEVQINCLA